MPAVQRKTVRQLINEGAILAVQDGNHGELHPTQEDYVPEGIPFVMASDLKGNDLDLITCKFLPEGLASTLRKGFALPGDVLLTHKGTLGLTTVVPALDTPYIMLTPQVTYYRVNSDALRPEYLHYVFSSPEFQKRLLCHVREGTRPYVGITAQLDLEIEYPNIDVQSAVVEELIALDRLIQITLQSIKHLEEAARLIYTEWFVRLRFPGHEKAKTSGSLPDGWRQETLGQRIELNYGKSLKESDRQPGKIPVFGSSGIVGSHSEALSHGPGIIVGRKGNVGSIFYSAVPFFAIDTVYFISPEQTTYFLLHTLQRMNFVSSDAAVPGLNRNYAYSQPVIWPSDSVLSEFEATCTPIYEQITTLEKQIAALKSARDLILPRLISGQLPL